MENLWDLYLRYDGPLPRDRAYTTSPVCWEMMMRAHLRTIRLKRHQNEWTELPELTNRIKQIHVHLHSFMV